MNVCAFGKRDVSACGGYNRGSEEQGGRWGGTPSTVLIQWVNCGPLPLPPCVDSWNKLREGKVYI